MPKDKKKEEEIIEEDSELEEIIEIKEIKDKKTVRPISKELFETREGMVSIHGSNSTMQSNLISQPLERTLEIETIKPTQQNQEIKELQYQPNSEEQKYDANAVSKDMNAPIQQAEHMSSSKLENLGREQAQMQTIQKQEFQGVGMENGGIMEDYIRPVKIRETQKMPGEIDNSSIDKDYTF